MQEKLHLNLIVRATQLQAVVVAINIRAKYGHVEDSCLDLQH